MKLSSRQCSHCATAHQVSRTDNFGTIYSLAPCCIVVLWRIKNVLSKQRTLSIAPKAQFSCKPAVLAGFEQAVIEGRMRMKRIGRLWRHGTHLPNDSSPLPKRNNSWLNGTKTRVTEQLKPSII